MQMCELKATDSKKEKKKAEPCMHRGLARSLQQLSYWAINGLN